MLNPETPPPMIIPATPHNSETTSSSSRRKNKTRVFFPFPSSEEVIDLESSFPTPLSFRGTTKSNAICVDQYDAVSNSQNIIDLSDTEDDDDDVRVLKFTPQTFSFSKRRKSEGECSNSVPFVCEICTETKTTRDSFNVTGCCHVYCKECVALYVESRLDENVVNVGCPMPGCRGLLEAEDCREILTPSVLDRWGKALCEAVISADEKFYCPFADCSGMLIHEGKEDIRETECPYCKRMFCAVCRVQWHPEISCEEFQKLNSDEREREDLLLMKLAKEMNWKRCPMCRIYVAKSEGCMYMKCRCGNAFCYYCGAPNLTTSHFCTNCRR